MQYFPNLGEDLLAFLFFPPHRFSQVLSNTVQGNSMAVLVWYFKGMLRIWVATRSRRNSTNQQGSSTCVNISQWGQVMSIQHSNTSSLGKTASLEMSRHPRSEGEF